jgi:hypothetical protein
MARYLEEAAAAGDFIAHASPLMTTHLKNELLQVCTHDIASLQKLLQVRA